jgi:hypothetical protein
MKLFYEQFHKPVVEAYANAYEQKVAYQLHSSAEIGLREYDIFTKEETRRESNRQGHEQRCDMCTYRDE